MSPVKYKILTLATFFLLLLLSGRVLAADYCENQDKSVYYTADRDAGCASGDQNASEFITYSTDLICCKKKSSSTSTDNGSSNSGSKTAFTNMEKIPGQEQTSDLVKYLNSIYTFGIAISAILALFMITLGGFTYIVTSAGNASKASDAKDMIFSAIYGLVLALAAYLILFVINPDLIEGTLKGVKTLDQTVQEKSEDGTASTGGTKDSQCLTTLSSDIDTASSQVGVDSAMIEAIIKCGEGCNSKQPVDGNGNAASSACGFSQMLYDNRLNVCGIASAMKNDDKYKDLEVNKETTCQFIQENTDFDMLCAATYLKNQAAKICGVSNSSEMTYEDAKKVASQYYTGNCSSCGTEANSDYCTDVADCFKNYN